MQLHPFKLNGYRVFDQEFVLAVFLVFKIFQIMSTLPNSRWLLIIYVLIIYIL